mmetsp:Transcript_9735/g.18566  ORF Transcript_9735/g.18566 Transcript_9735/m.18566 type:complete len:359 (+) Transcript_9735:44-1120(+)
MGVCHSNNAKGSNTPLRDIKSSKNDKDNDGATKLLLLGAGDVGKSTFVKQLRICLNGGFTAAEKDDYVPVVQHNIISAIQSLITALDQRPQRDVTLSTAAAPLKDKLLAIPECYGNHSDESNAFFTATLASDIHTMWNDKAIQKVYATRREKGSQNCSLPDSAGYFLSRVLEVAEPKYVPTNEDILRAKARTTGFVEVAVRSAEANKVVVFDVGGQRAERKKWAHCRESATAVVFFASASCFDQVLVEDEVTNRLSEDVKLFRDVLAMFPNKPVVLVLNKKDILKGKLSDSKARPVTDFFPSCKLSGKGPNAVPSYFEWLEAEFLSGVERKIKVIHLASLDTQSCHTAFNDISTSLQG